MSGQKKSQLDHACHVRSKYSRICEKNFLKMINKIIIWDEHFVNILELFIRDEHFSRRHANYFSNMRQTLFKYVTYILNAMNMFSNTK